MKGNRNCHIDLKLSHYIKALDHARVLARFLGGLVLAAANATKQWELAMLAAAWLAIVRREKASTVAPHRNLV